MLFEYLQQTQRFLRDAKMKTFNPKDLITYVNRARRMTAFRAECCRVLTPISGAITGWSITDAGVGYSSAPIFTVSPPDFPSGALPYPNGSQATATGIVQSGSIAAIFSDYGGAGYFQPELTITDSTGTGAAAVAQLTFINQLNQGQEVYPFTGIDLSQNPGAEKVYAALGLQVIYNNYRYGCPIYDFQTYQNMIRQYPFQYQYVPTFASQFGQGADGSFYVYPLPSQTYQYELDCLVIPSDLNDDHDHEIIPSPWTDAVPYFAAHLAYLESQNINVATYYLELFDKMMPRFSIAARPWRTINPYGRY